MDKYETLNRRLQPEADSPPAETHASGGETRDTKQPSWTLAPES